MADFIGNHGLNPDDLQRWTNEFRDRLIRETIVELRWPAYDAKTGDIDENQEAIRRAVLGKKPKAEGLPAEALLTDPKFVEIHRIFYGWVDRGGE